MRILFLCYRGNPFCGGQGIYLYHLTKELAKLGAQIDVIVGPPYPEPIEGWARVYRLDNLNLWAERTRRLPYEKLVRVLSPWHFTDYMLTRFHVFPEMETFSMRAFFLLGNLLRERRYDIIHDVQCLGWGLLPMKEYGMPIVTTVHHPLSHDRRADFMIDRNMWEKFCTVMFYPLTMQKTVINRLDRVITSSRSGIKDLGSEFGVSPGKVSVVYNGMDVEGFRNTGEKREGRMLLFVGNTEDHKKGMRYLFEALSLLPEDVTLTIVDEGPPRRLSAWTIITEMGLEKRVRFTGKVDISALVSLYSRATVLVMSSLHEGFGLPAAEAMACETPVVATTAGALPEVVGDDGAGILVPPRDGKAIADAVMKLLGDGKLRREMGKKGRKRTEEKFAWPVAAKNTLQVYRDVIESYRRAV
ncbi:MAG: glycosyltransferase family 1 protein [Spirochaetes bacterium]|nr:MAG: glycosyltransferase family 1 protein [Spirochaetota bacterium]